MIHLATGVLVRAERLLMVASRYRNHAQPLWNLPGGRQLAGELLSETVVREVFEETGLRVRTRELAYVSESYDGATHFLNVTYRIEPLDAAADDTLLEVAVDDTRADHVAEVAWVPVAQVAQRIAVGVVREPLVAYLSGSLPHRYAGFHDAGVTVEWPPDSQ